MLQIDHLAVLCKRLEDGVAAVEAALGTPLAPGGQHEVFGTHNRLLSLGPDTYLEVIAIDPQALRPDRPRWFGLDDFSGPPRLARWIARTDDLDGVARAAGPDLVGPPLSLARGVYAWRMAVRADGQVPFDGVFPTVLQWDGPHPAPMLPDQGLRLTELLVGHPDHAGLADSLARCGAVDPRLRIDAQNTPALSARLSTPRGDVILRPDVTSVPA